MTDGLQRLNTMTEEEGEKALLSCCGSKNWARRLIDQRPFGDEQALVQVSDSIWRELTQDDWLEAFIHHPKIGEKKAAKVASAQAQRWSEQEQAGEENPQTLVALQEANRAYEERFGYIFMVCATGKSKEEMLAILRERLQNDPGTEIQVAAEEQRKITNLRLEKLLQS